MFCAYARWKIARLTDSRTAPGPRLQSHLDSCEHCRALLAEQGRIDALLRQPSAQDDAACGPPEGLHAAIMRRVRQSSAPAPRFAESATPRPLLLAALAVLAAAAVVFTRSPLDLPTSETAAGPGTELPRSMPDNDLATALSQAFGVSASHPGILVDESISSPYTTELAGLRQDTQAAARFLEDCISF